MKCNKGVLEGGISKFFNKKVQSKKKKMGMSSKFHVGGDLNQILGLLSNYKYISKQLKKELKKIIIKNKNYRYPENWRYAIQHENKNTSSKILMTKKLMLICQLKAK